MQTFYWHDYETWGTNPAIDRPAQFAGLRTDAELNVIGQPLVIYCRPPVDILPQPEACLITGITPQKAEQEGLSECDFVAAIHAEFARPGTCGAGYNSLRFDDEVTRHALYRNFYDPYAREWQGGNSRWDLIDLLRTCRTLRPDGIEWPDHADGSPSFKLEHLTAANGLDHAAAHDALSDVTATIALARLVKTRQSGLYHYYLRLRNKREVAALLDPAQRKPVVHFSGRIAAARGCGTLMVPLMRHPGNANGVICYDLSVDPGPLLELDPEQIRRRIFGSAEELAAEGYERIPLKTIHINRCPMVATARLVDRVVADRMGLDLAACERHYQRLYSADLDETLAAVFAPAEQAPRAADCELQLYGGFVGDSDRTSMARIRSVPPEQLTEAEFAFADVRLKELLWRYRARNFPASLSEEAKQQWRRFCRQRLAQGPGLSLAEYRQRIARLRIESAGDGKRLALLAELDAHANGLAAACAEETRDGLTPAPQSA